jgi:hypothetical protein
LARRAAPGDSRALIRAGMATDGLPAGLDADFEAM